MNTDGVSLVEWDAPFKIVICVTLIFTSALAVVAGAFCQVVPRLGEAFDAEYPRLEDFALPVGLEFVAIVFLGSIILNGLLLLVPNRRVGVMCSLLLFIMSGGYLGYVGLAYFGAFVSLASQCFPGIM